MESEFVTSTPHHPQAPRPSFRSPKSSLDPRSATHHPARMKILRTLLVTAFLLIGLPGCLQIENVIKLKADGSGTIEEKVMMSKATVAQIAEMTAGFGDAAGAKKDGKPAKGFDLMDEEKLKAAAEKKGAGVTFVGARKIDNESGNGFIATYAFTDINKVKLDQNPSDVMPTPGGQKGAGGPGGSKSEPVTFKFTKGATSELTVKMPTPDLKEAAKKKEKAGADMEEMAMQMMQQMFKDMKISMAIEVAGAIKETNAEYKDGSRVTLMEMDFNKLLANPEKFKKLAKENPKTLQESKALMKGIDGVKVETAPEVKIKFQ